jgi:hypothetical protein
MYTLNIPVSTIRTKMRQEFERHRYVSKLKTTDVLIYNSHAEFQVRMSGGATWTPKTEGLTLLPLQQETLNFWKQLTHVLKYFRAEEDPKARLPKTFIAGFLEVRNNSMLPDPAASSPIAPYAMLYAVLTSLFLLAGPQLKSRHYVHSQTCSGVTLGNFLNLFKIKITKPSRSTRLQTIWVGRVELIS